MVAVADPIQPLFQPFGRSATGYLGVYVHRRLRDGGCSYSAMFKVGQKLRKLAIYRDVKEAAARVAAEYARVYGPDWPYLVRGRWGRNPWAVRRAFEIGKRDGRVVRLQIGWTASVWVRGREVVLGGHLDPADPGRDRRRPRPWLFDTKDAAVAAVRRWRAVAAPRRYPEGAAAIWR